MEGVLQDAVGTRARLGFTFYNTNNGGHIQVEVADPSLASVVTAINDKRPDSNTPLAEALYTVAGYFAQSTCSSTLPGHGTVVMTICVVIVLIHITMERAPRLGGPHVQRAMFSISLTVNLVRMEACLPAWSITPVRLHIFPTFNCSGKAARQGLRPRPRLTCSRRHQPWLPACSGNAVAGIEDVALWAHTTDLRSDISGQISVNLTLYTVFAFGKGSTLLNMLP